jgi:hypothetical protein
MRLWQGIFEPWDAWTLKALSFVDGGDRVLVRQVMHGEGRGPELDMEFSVVYTMRKGNALVLEYFWDHNEALETVGLSEQDAHADS